MILLVIDTQKGIMNNKLFSFEKVKSNIVHLIKEARNNNVEVVFVRHDDGVGSGFSVGDDDFEIYPDFAPVETEKVFDKTVNSAFHEMTGLTDYLLTKGIKKVIIVGLQTDYCIDATIKSGFEHGFEMIVPEYTNSTFDNKYMKNDVSYHYYNEHMWPNRYAACISMEKAVKLLKR